jgi:hypothetical protein
LRSPWGEWVERGGTTGAQHSNPGYAAAAFIVGSQEGFAVLAAEQESVAASVGLLERLGPDLPVPHSSGVVGSRHGHMRELRVQHRGRPLRVLYAFDPRHVGLLLVGGDKTGDRRWYDVFVPVADRIYGDHIVALKTEHQRNV